MKSLRMTLTVATVAAVALSLAACGQSDDPASNPSSSGASTSQAAGGDGEGLTMLFGSSTPAETAALDAAADAWSAQTGISVKVTPAADLNQELSQGFAANNPPDVFYMSADQFVSYAQDGGLYAYGDSLANKDDFYPTLRETFTYEDKFYCAPKDFSTLALIINTDIWAEAGLTDSDIPTTWDELKTVAAKLTTGDRVGLTFTPEFARMGVFMAQNGGWLISDDGKPTANTQENVDALTFVKSMMEEGSLKLSSDLGAGWGGEAFGKKMAAMTIEGNWISGAMDNDYADVKWKAVELPAGPEGKGTMQFTNCLGISEQSAHKDDAVAFVEFLTSSEQQMKFAEAFGPMPSVVSAAADYKSANPDRVPFMNGVEYAKGVLTMPGSADVVTDLNAGLQQLAVEDPASLLDSAQTNLEAIYK